MGYKKTCFNCRKLFNRPIDFGTDQVYPCPDCSNHMVLMNHKFRPPKKDNESAWQIIEFLSSHGFIFQPIFETPNGGAYVSYPTTKRDADDFVIRYREQSIKWNEQVNNKIEKTSIQSAEQISQLLTTYSRVYLNLSEVGYNKKYFYELVEELENCSVQEVRPIQFISIERDIHVSELNLQKDSLIDAIMTYCHLRTTVYKMFVEHLGLNKATSFSEIIESMEVKGQRPRGKFRNWNFWQHGGDIEFENRKTNEHLSVLMQNKRALNSDSLYKFIHERKEYEQLVKVIAGKQNNLERMINLLVIDGRLIDIDNELRMKIITLEEVE